MCQSAYPVLQNCMRPSDNNTLLTIIINRSVKKLKSLCIGVFIRCRWQRNRASGNLKYYKYFNSFLHGLPQCTYIWFGIWLTERLPNLRREPKKKKILRYFFRSDNLLPKLDCEFIYLFMVSSLFSSSFPNLQFNFWLLQS